MGALDGIENIIYRNILDAMNEILIDIQAAIVEEIPKQSGDAANSVKIIPAKFHNGQIIGSISIGDNKTDYIFALIYGYEADYNDGPYNFPSDKWPAGPSQLLGNDNYYHFLYVHHSQKPNDFVERALNRLNWQDIFTQKLLEKINLNITMEINA